MTLPFARHWLAILRFATLILLAGIPAGSAAPITWATPVGIAADTDVSTAGAGVWAFCYHASPPILLNGVSFTAETVGAITWASSASPYANTTPNFAGASPLSAAYKQVLYGATYCTGAPVTLTLNNLTPNHQYRIQLWADDSRTQYNRSQTLTSPGGNTVTQQYNTGTGAGGLGQYVMGSFTANATTQQFTVSGNAVSQVNAIQLRDLSIIAAPVFAPVAGTYAGAQTVTLTAEAGSTIHYTTNGTLPNNTSPSGTAGSGTATVSVPASLTLKAFAVKSGKTDSAVTTAAYVITLTSPAFNPPPGNHLGTQTVTLTGEPGTTVFYTTDGNMPGPASAHGETGTGTATVSVTAPGSMLISAIATQAGKPDSALATGYYRAVSAMTESPVFTGPRREGTNKDGVIKMRWGLEQTMMFEDGIFKSWYHGTPMPEMPGDYWNSGAIRYATSPDGINWTDQGLCLGNTPYHRGCPHTYHLKTATAAGEPAGYYMPVGRNGQFGFDLFYSTTGLPGSWVWLNNSNLIIPLGPAGAWDAFRTGNICIWYENNQWQVMYEAGAGSGVWQVGRAYGPSLTNLTKYAGNPVIPYGGPGTAIGGNEVHKVGHTYYVIVHETDPSINWTPTSCSLFKSTDLNHWTRMGWLSREWVYKNNEAQVADGSMVSVNGKTYFWYEDVQYQNPQLPELSLMTWDMPFEELVQRPEMWDDVVAEGWAYDPGFGEVLSTPGTWPSTYIRKIGNPIPPNCMVLKTDATHGLRLRKPLGPTNNRFNFSARASQTTVKFTPLRLDADASNTVMAGAFFDSDGMIKYYQGAGVVTARAYAANTTYTFTYDCAPTNYSLSINGKLIASNIPYATAGAPAYFKIEQNPGGTSYVGSPQPVDAARWSGAVNGIWDTTTANWIATGPPANRYAAGDTVRFDDTATGTGPVAVTITPTGITPGGMVVENATRDYRLDGGGITGVCPLVKRGGARLELAGNNDYAGATEIAAGTLSVSGSLAGGTCVSVAAGASFDLTTDGVVTFKPAANGVVNTLGGTGTAVFDGRFDLNLAAADTAAGNSWRLVNAPTLAETYGANFQVTGFRETQADSGVWTTIRGTHQWTFAESSGLLSVQTATYTTWINSFFPGAADPSVTGPDADPDGDGMDNGIEFLTGSMPDDSSSRNAPLVSTAAADLVVTFQRVDAAELNEVAVESSTTLQAPWTPVVVPNDAVTGPPVTVLDKGSDPDDITVVIPANGDPKKFARVRITIPATP